MYKAHEFIRPLLGEVKRQNIDTIGISVYLVLAHYVWIILRVDLGPSGLLFCDLLVL